MKYFVFIGSILMLSCLGKDNKRASTNANTSFIENSEVSLYVLGTVQDGGSPHIGCQKECCADLFNNPDPSRKVVSLGVIDHQNQQTFLFEATPDITSQMKLLKNYAEENKETPDGIFLTHAHMGHYSGLMYLGREALGGKQIPVYAMPKMKTFLKKNGPWNQLLALKNIVIRPIKNGDTTKPSQNLQVIPFTVPHRDEYSETVGFKIVGPNKSALFIPDIDKWSKWKKNIVAEIQKVDLAFLDATFYDGFEINTRNISEIPHPFVIESMELFSHLPLKEKNKIHFIHFNHTNPLLNPKSKASQEVLEKGYNIADFGQRFSL
ncbi:MULTISPECIES: MBL fold metallo-hydrolase [Flavobacteriaceae]|uniref:MBL fold metallo-hydrolase n=1 Tax=Flavobacteriaceae TaxID=49546 RepID=UPI001492AB50|nr:MULTISPECIES: MBL fold metallo-hydrolase [Allomuricauda]MDC6366760.1 MBL fold metallo-hydrolase [Muricauda sp. AC10]